MHSRHAGRLVTATVEPPQISFHRPGAVDADYGGTSPTKLLIVLGVATALGPISIDTYLSALPSIRHGLSATSFAVELSVTACLIGLGVGQLTAGPLSDVWGRRRPMLAGVGLFTVFSALCSVAPSIQVLIALRFAQGMAGAVGIVITRAVIADLYDPARARRYFATLMAISGIAPMLAPLLGAQVLEVSTWPGVFAVIATLGLLLTIGVATIVPETLPSAGRQHGGLKTARRTAARLCAESTFLGYTLSGGLAFAAMFAYISASPFVLENLNHLSPAGFAGVFALNAAGIVVAAQASNLLTNRVTARRLLGVGLTIALAGATLLLFATIVGSGLGLILFGLFLAVSPIGMISPNSTALAMSDRIANTAGGAAALIGVAQFTLGGLAAGLIGVAGNHTALPMATVIIGFTTAASIAFMTLTRGSSLTVENHLAGIGRRRQTLPNGTDPPA